MRDYSKQYIQVYTAIGASDVNSYCGYVEIDDDKDFIRLQPFDLEDGYLEESVKTRAAQLNMLPFVVDIRKNKIIAIHILPKIK